MTNPSLRVLVEAAENDIDTYRNPEISEAQARLNEILAAAGLGRPRTDKITRLRVTEETVYVEIAYSVRGCICDDSFEFPASILDAPDPVRAATLWGLGEERAKVARQIDQAKLSLVELEGELAEVDARLAAA